MESLPPPWWDSSLRGRIADRIAHKRRCLVVLDDDPTGTQTVHDVWVLARWEIEDLRRALATGDPAFYILTNSRSMTLAKAQQLNREIAVRLLAAAEAESREIAIVSRSDSTLRGHFPGELEALTEALTAAQGAPFDGVCVVPSFPEAGRFTVNDVHWVAEGDQLIPAAQTPYARDPIFGYKHSSLPEWVEEKTAARILASQVVSISLKTIRTGGPSAVASLLRQAQAGQIIVVNSASYRDLEVFVYGLMQVEADGKRFMFRTAASFVKVASGLADRQLLTAAEMTGHRPRGGGLVVFGSHVPKSTQQLASVRSLEGIEEFEVQVPGILDESTRPRIMAQAVAHVNNALAAGHDALLFTSRELVTHSDPRRSLAIGRSVSTALREVVRRIGSEPRYVIAKGGITASDVATHGMGMHAARVLGQLLPGVPVWQLGPDSRWPGVPLVVFPGNVGEPTTVAAIVIRLRG